MSVQAVPVCNACEKPITDSVVYAATCDHDACPSACWHGVCLMEWRDERDEAEAMMAAMLLALGVVVVEAPPHYHPN